MSLNPLTWFKRTPPKKVDALAPYRNAYHEKMVALVHREAKERALFETALNYGAPYDLINPWASFYDGLKLLFPLLPARFDGANGGSYIYLSQTQLDLLRSYSRWLYETNSYAQSALETLADYTLGASGFQYIVSARRHVVVNKKLLTKYNKFLEDFLNANEFWHYERSLFIARKRDGDVFGRLFPQGDGVTQFRQIEPEHVRSTTLSDWSYGIKVDPEDPSKRLAYNVWYSPTDVEEVPADEMIMFKNHTGPSVRRGLSDFFAVHESLYDSANLQRASRQGEAVRAAIAYIRQYAYAPPEAVNSLQAQDTDFQLPRFTGNSTNAAITEPAHKVMPGEVIDIPDGLEFKGGPSVAGSADNVERILNASLNSAAVKWRFPAYFLNGNSNFNFAAALVAEAPFTKATERLQFVQKKDYCKVCEMVLRIGIEQDLLPPDLLDDCEVTCEGTPIAARNLKDETTINEILYQNGLLSRRTWAAREGLDYDVEQDNRSIEDNGAPELPDKPPEKSTSFNAQYARETGPR